jgi:hypothetical protein
MITPRLQYLRIHLKIINELSELGVIPKTKEVVISVNPILRSRIVEKEMVRIIYEQSVFVCITEKRGILIALQSEASPIFDVDLEWMMLYVELLDEKDRIAYRENEDWVIRKNLESTRKERSGQFKKPK